MVTNGAADRHEVGSAKWLWDGWEVPELSGKGLLPLLKSLRFFFSNGLISPRTHTEYRKPRRAFPVPILSSTNAHARHGSLTLPGVLCMEPAGKTSEMCGTRE